MPQRLVILITCPARDVADGRAWIGDGTRAPR